MKNPPSYKTKYDFNPNTKLNGKNEGSANKILNGLTFIVKKSNVVKRFIGVSPLGICNFAIVERSNVLTNNYASTFKYGEHAEHPNFFAAVNALFGILILLPLIMVPFL